MAVPGVDAGEPVGGGRIGIAAQEDADEQVFYRLRGGQVGVNPELVAWLEVGDGGDGEGRDFARGCCAGNADVDAGSDEVEASVRGVGGE